MKRTILTLGFLMAITLAMSVTVEQTGADSGKIMKSELFTIEASDWSGECTSANIDFSECPVCSLQNEDSVKSVSDLSSISWTTVAASQVASNQRITVSLSGCSPPESETSSSFEVILPPELSATVSPTAFSSPSGSRQVSLTVENNGENTAQDVTASISLPSGVTTSDDTTHNIGTLSGSSSSGVAWTLSFSSPVTSTITVTISSSNAGSTQKSILITVPVTDDDDDDSSSSSSSGGAAPSTEEDNETTESSGEQTQTQVQIREEKILNLKAGEPKRFEIQARNEIKAITIKSSKGGLVIVSFEKLTSSPQGLPEPLMNRLNFFEINANEEIDEAEIEFEISEEELKRSKIKLESVKMLRWTTKWETLETTYIGKYGPNYQFKAKSPGFSYFTIGFESEKSTEIVETSEKVTNETLNTNKWIPRLIILGILLLVIFLSYLFFIRRGL